MSQTATAAYFWEAVATVETESLAFSLQTTKQGRTATSKLIFSARWLTDGIVYLDASKRLGGWLKKQLPQVRSTYANQIQAVKVFPIDGTPFSPVCKVNELEGGNIPIPENNYDIPADMPVPKWDYIQVPKEKGTGTRTAPTYYLTYSHPTKLQVKIVSFARSITPEIIKEALSYFGRVEGIGDKHSVGFGRFTLIDFNVIKKEKMNL